MPAKNGNDLQSHADVVKALRAVALDLLGGELGPQEASARTNVLRALSDELVRASKEAQT